MNTEGATQGSEQDKSASEAQEEVQSQPKSRRRWVLPLGCFTAFLAAAVFFCSILPSGAEPGVVRVTDAQAELAQTALAENSTQPAQSQTQMSISTEPLVVSTQQTSTSSEGEIQQTTNGEAENAKRLGKHWYFAEGTTEFGFLTVFSVLNPNSSPVTVDVVYKVVTGEVIGRQHIVPALTRYTIIANDEAEVGINKTFATNFSSDRTVVVERSMYVGSDGHDTIGADILDTKWYFAEGFTGPTNLPPDQKTQTFILINNPNDIQATVLVTYYIENGEPVTRTHIIQPGRYTIHTNLDEEVGPDKAFSTIVISDQPIMAERAMYFGEGMHISIGERFPDD